MRNADKSNNEAKGRVFSYVRWSSDKQTTGDSERRQTDPALDWCQRNGRVLDTGDYTDPGVSGWKGAHRKHGRLGVLLGIVRENDTILVEEASRWSREPALDSLNALRDTVNKGVSIVFLKTGQVINRDNFNRPDVFLTNALNTFMANAENEERARKIREAMGERRAQIEGGKAVKGQMPCWLKWEGTRDAGKVVVIEEKAEVVRRIFKLSITGMGVGSIVRELHDTPCVTHSLSNKRARWNTRTIYRILTDKSVIGHYARNGLSVPGVFPAIVAESDFYGSLEKMKKRSNFTAPRKYENSSLFTGLCKCSVCGNSLIKVRTGHGGKYYDYLCCAQGVADKNQARCQVHGKGIRYKYLESTFLGLFSNEDAIRAALLHETPAPSSLDVLKGKLASVQDRLNKLSAELEGDDNPARRVMDLIKKLEGEETALQSEIEAEAARRKVSTPPLQTYVRIRAQVVQSTSLDRGALRLALRDVVERIEVKLGQGEYVVYLKGAAKPVGVQIFAANVKG